MKNGNNSSSTPAAPPSRAASEVPPRENLVVVAGGGTGGHLIPNAVIGTLIERHLPPTRCVHVGNDAPMDRAIFAQYGIRRVHFVKGRPFARAGLIGKLASLWLIAINFFRCVTWLKRARPRLVIGVGGYSSIPMILAARRLKIPVILQEQNRVPGMANRWLAPIASRVLIGFEDAAQFFRRLSDRKKCVYTGNFNITRLRGDTGADSRATTGGGGGDANAPRGTDSAHTLIFSGGSQGARAINDAARAIVPKLVLRRPDMGLVWQCGERWRAACARDIGPIADQPRVRLIGLAENFYDYYRGAILCVCRAGALTVADIIASATPAIFVPFPGAADNHQMKNAEYLAARGAAVISDQSQDGWIGRLDNLIFDLLGNPQELKRMKAAAEAIRRATPPVAALLSVVGGTPSFGGGKHENLEALALKE